MPFVVAPEEKSELLCTFAALLLHDEGLKVDGDNIQKLITAAGAQIEPYWPKLYANMLANKKIGDLLNAAPAAGAPAAAAPAAAGKADDKKGGADKKGADKKGGDKKEKAKEKAAEKEDDDEGGADMGFSLFD